MTLIVLFLLVFDQNFKFILCWLIRTSNFWIIEAKETLFRSIAIYSRWPGGFQSIFTPYNITHCQRVKLFYSLTMSFTKTFSLSTMCVCHQPSACFHLVLRKTKNRSAAFLMSTACQNKATWAFYFSSLEAEASNQSLAAERFKVKKG